MNPFALAAMRHCWSAALPAGFDAAQAAAADFSVAVQAIEAASSVEFVGALQASRASPQPWTQLTSRLMHPLAVATYTDLQVARSACSTALASAWQVSI